jgi:hypothetical protein
LLPEHVQEPTQLQRLLLNSLPLKSERMNIKVLASLGVVVALLTAWLFASLYSSAQIQLLPGADAPEELSAGPLPGSTLGGQSQNVRTSVEVANTDVTTTVRVAE